MFQAIEKWKKERDKPAKNFNLKFITCRKGSVSFQCIYVDCELFSLVLKNFKIARFFFTFFKIYFIVITIICL